MPHGDAGGLLIIHAQEDREVGLIQRIVRSKNAGDFGPTVDQALDHGRGDGAIGGDLRTLG